MRQFIIRMAGIISLIATVLVLEGLIMGSLSFLAAMVLLPVAGVSAICLLGAGAHSKPQKRRRRVRYPAGARQQPRLRVTLGANSPKGPRAA